MSVLVDMVEGATFGLNGLAGPCARFPPGGAWRDGVQIVARVVSPSAQFWTEGGPSSRAPRRRPHLGCWRRRATLGLFGASRRRFFAHGGQSHGHPNGKLRRARRPNLTVP